MLRRDAAQTFGRGLAAALASVPSREDLRSFEGVITLWATDWRVDERGEELTIPWPALFADFAKRRYFRGARYQSGWTPAVFSPPLRLIGIVRGVSALVLAIDATSGLDTDAAAELFGHLYGLVHTDADHRRGSPSLRVIIPFRELTSLACHARATHALRRQLAAIGFTRGVRVLRATEFSYLPSTTPGNPFEVRHLAGAIFDPDVPHE